MQLPATRQVFNLKADSFWIIRIYHPRFLAMVNFILNVKLDMGTIHIFVKAGKWRKEFVLWLHKWHTAVDVLLLGLENSSGVIPN